MTFFDFLVIFKNLPEPDETYIAITGFSLSADNAKLTFSVLNPYTEIPTDMKFRVEVTGLEAYKIVKTECIFIDLKNEHPILWHFNTTHGDLYFSGEVPNAKAVLADLYKVNDRVFGGLLPIDSWFNGGTDVLSVLGSHSGLLASGSVNILDCYSDVLIKHNVTHSIVVGNGPGYKDGAKLSTQQVLLLGDCYFVGKEFDFFRIDECSSK